MNLITGIYNSKYRLDKIQTGIKNIKLNKKLKSIKNYMNQVLTSLI